MNRFSLLIVAALLAAVIPASSSTTTEPTEPFIDAIHGRIVRVRIPAGFDRVTLQQRVLARKATRAGGDKRWRTVSTHYPRGADGVVKFRLRTLVGKRFLRVLGNKVEPLPGSFLTGLTNFLPDPLANPDGSGVTLDRSGGITTSGVSDGVGGNLTAGGGGGESTRTVTESDIWRVQGNRLYFFNELRGLQSFDLSNPEAPALLGTLRMPGSGEDMYLLGTTHAVLLKRSSNWWGGWYEGGGIVALANTDATRARLAISPRAAGSESSELIIADVRAGAPTLVARVPVDGSIAESRLVGSVLYVASNVNRAATDTTPAEYGLQLTSFDLTDAAHPVQRDAVFLGGWANAVTATDRFFLVAKYAVHDGTWSTNTIDLIDISSPDGAMQRAGQVSVKGNIDNKFNMHIEGDVLTAVAQVWGWDETDDEPNGSRWSTVTKLQTFSIADRNAPAPLASINIAPGETLRAVRFDGDRAYVVTFRQIDPLFVVDLLDAARPTIAGHVEAPGFSTYIEPLGDRLVTIGLVDWRPAVSLFDVSDPSQPKLLSQLTLGGDNNSWSHSEAVWNEKAFKVLPDQNLILLPVSGYGEADGWFSRVQLIDLLPDSLVKRGTIAQQFSPRRATLVKKSIVAISPTRLVTVDATDRDKPLVQADLEIAWRVDRVFAVGRYLLQVGGSADWNDNRPPTLSVALAGDPEDTRTSLDLPNIPVIGAVVKDDVLYLAQGKGHYYWDDTEDADAAKQTLAVRAYDLAGLPSLRLLGKTSAQTRIIGGDLTAHWPSPGILVWAGSGSTPLWWGPIWYDTPTFHVNAVPGGPVRIAANVTTAAPDGETTTGDDGSDTADDNEDVSDDETDDEPTEDPVVDPPGYWGHAWFSGSSAHLVAFDVTRPQEPKFLSDITVGKDQPWELSDPFAAEGMLFLSYRFFGDAIPHAGNENRIDKLARQVPTGPAGDDPDVARANRHFLVRVDYSDPALPVIDDTQINLPGKLRGLAREGRLLFTVGRNYDVTAGIAKSGESALQVSAFDGSAAHLLDTLPLKSTAQPVVISGETIYTLEVQAAQIWVPGPHDPILFETRATAGIAVSAIVSDRYWWGGGSWKPNDRNSLLSAWRLEDTGKFTKLDEIETGHDSSLFLLGQLVVTQDYNRTLRLFDASDPAALGSLGSFSFDGWVTPDVRHADGGLDSGLWVPLGRYGVEVVAWPQPSAN